VLGTLSEREAGVVSMRFGLTDGQPKTLDEIGKVYGVTRERIRQIESKTMSKLRRSGHGIGGEKTRRHRAGPIIPDGSCLRTASPPGIGSPACVGWAARRGPMSRYGDLGLFLINNPRVSLRVLRPHSCHERGPRGLARPRACQGA